MENASSSAASSDQDRPSPHSRFDLLLVGGGLQNGLIALLALHHDPQRRIGLVERGNHLGGNHTWCFHPADVPADVWPLLEPWLERAWDGYEVRFPDLERTLDGRYGALTSERMSRHLQALFERAPHAELFLDAEAVAVGPHEVRLADGRRLSGELVIDSRGPDASAFEGRTGFQKFVGLELVFEQPHGRRTPILMDATVSQDGGFSFLYCLPFDDHRMLVEDTAFAASAGLDYQAGRRRALEYAKRFGEVTEVIREEHGVLPMPWQTDFAPPSASPLSGGYGGGWFHPATGYSVPACLRLAMHVARTPTARVFGPELDKLFKQQRQQASYAEHLNYLLFHGFDPHMMWNVFRRFYTLPRPLIDRFYALSLSFADRARIMVGAPPRGFRWTAALGAGRLAAFNEGRVA